MSSVYLRGISFTNLEATINFMYYGEVCISQETLRYASNLEEFCGSVSNDTGHITEGTGSIPAQQYILLASGAPTDSFKL